MHIVYNYQEVAKHLRPHTLRAKFGVDKVRNAVHCTDLPDDASLEVSLYHFMHAIYEGNFMHGWDLQCVVAEIRMLIV